MYTYLWIHLYTNIRSGVTYLNLLSNILLLHFEPWLAFLTIQKEIRTRKCELFIR